MKLLRKNRKGFTLVELIVVIAIIGILAAILIPQFGGFQDRAREKAAISEARAVATAIAAYMADSTTGAAPADTADLSGFLDNSSSYGEIAAVTATDEIAKVACTAHAIDSSNFKYTAKNSLIVIVVGGEYKIGDKPAA